MAASNSPFQRRYPPEMRERAIRMVHEGIAESGERVGAVTRVARQLGIGRLQHYRPVECAANVCGCVAEEVVRSVSIVGGVLPACTFTVRQTVTGATAATTARVRVRR